jgi:UDP-2,3-diacylglucosamine hydrolase
MIQAWLLSDLHLKTINERNANILLRFLLSLRNRQRPATHLFLVGDIFDIWFGGNSDNAQRFAPIVDLLLDIHRQGIEVHYFEGNHDVHLSGFWREKYGIPCWTRPQYFRIGSHVIRVEHGDLINLEDKAYLRLRRVLRSFPLEFLAEALPTKLVVGVGERASGWSRNRSVPSRKIHSEELRAMIRNHAQRAFKEHSFDIIVTGHMHVKDDWEFQVGDRKVRSINLGSWFDEPKVLSIGENVQWHPLQ